MNRADYMHCLYAASLGYMQPTFDPYMRVGCAYLLFCLHGSQRFDPERKPAKIQLVEGSPAIHALTAAAPLLPRCSPAAAPLLLHLAFVAAPAGPHRLRLLQNYGTR